MSSLRLYVCRTFVRPVKIADLSDPNFRSTKKSRSLEWLRSRCHAPRQIVLDSYDLTRKVCQMRAARVRNAIYKYATGWKGAVFYASAAMEIARRSSQSDRISLYEHLNMFIEKGQRGVKIGKHTKIKNFSFLQVFFFQQFVHQTLVYRFYHLNIVRG